MKYLLNRIDPENNFTTHLIKLFEQYRIVDKNALGVKDNWYNEPLWKE